VSIHHSGVVRRPESQRGRLNSSGRDMRRKVLEGEVSVIPNFLCRLECWKREGKKRGVRQPKYQTVVGRGEFLTMEC